MNWTIWVFLLVGATVVSGCASTEQGSAAAQSSSTTQESATAQNEGFSPGENLITPFESDLQQWDFYTKEEGNLRSFLWQSGEPGRVNAFVVSIYLNDEEDLDRIRELNDQPGRERCAEFSSEEITHESAGPYQSLLWETYCEKEGGAKAKLIHLAVQGSDSFYHVQKIWQGTWSDEEVATWLSRMQKIHVCDTRSEAAPCPKGYERAGGA